MGSSQASCPGSSTLQGTGGPPVGQERRYIRGNRQEFRTRHCDMLMIKQLGLRIDKADVQGQYLLSPCYW